VSNYSINKHHFALGPFFSFDVFFFDLFCLGLSFLSGPILGPFQLKYILGFLDLRIFGSLEAVGIYIRPLVGFN